MSNIDINIPNIDIYGRLFQYCTALIVLKQVKNLSSSLLILKTVLYQLSKNYTKKIDPFCAIYKRLISTNFEI